MVEKSKIVYEGRALSLNIEQATYPDGSSGTLEIIRHPGGAAAVAVNSNNEVCLIRQFRYATGGWLWELPAGRIEIREDPLDTAKRELDEEAGIIASQWDALGLIYPSPGICDERIYLYLARGLSYTKIMHEEDEYIEVHWVPIDDASDWIRQGKITDAKTIIGLYDVQALGVEA